MDSPTAAEAFPALYRAILDGVAGLEGAGQRADAHRIRREATAAYSGAWGEAGRRRLEALVARLERTLDGHGPDAEAAPGPRTATPAPGPRLTGPGSPLRNAAETR